MRRGRKRPAGPPAPPDPEALAVRPVRTAEWSETEREPEGTAAGGPAEPRVVIERPLPPVRSLSSFLQRVSALTGVRRLRLDAPGSFVWRRLDGSRTVGELAGELRARLPGSEPGDSALGEAPGRAAEGEVEARVVRFVALLRREGLVGLQGLDDRRIEAWRARGGARPDGPAGNPRA